MRGAGAPAVVERARALGLLGWVRAHGAGLLRVHAEGAPDAVERLRAALEVVEEEPAGVEGHEQFAVRGVPAGAFAVLERGRGFELRLDVDGAARCWSVPKGPSLDPAVKRFAVEVADPEPGGTAWDRGTYEQGGRVPWPEALDRGHAVFVLHGERLRGGFVLQRTRGAQWLLLKRRDEHAAA